MRARSTSPNLALLSAVMALSAIIAGPAAAQPSPHAKAAAEALFNEGRVLMGEGKFAKACEKFEASNDFDPSVGTQLNLGVCREQNGQPAVAWEVFRGAAELASATSDGRESYARERMGIVAKELHFVVIEVADQDVVEGLQVHLDDAPVPAATWNRPLIVAAGEHVVRATAPERVAFEARVDASTPGEEARVAIPLLALPAVTEPVATVPEPVAMEPLAPPADSEPPMPMKRKLALGSGAVGVVGLAFSGVLGLSASGMYQEAEDGYALVEEVCQQSGAMSAECITERESNQADRDAARSRANLATATAVIGIAAVTAGVILWYTTPPAAQEAATPTAATRIAPLLGRDVAGLTLHTSF